MPGGLLNLVAYGRLNIILNGNPSKTFFKTSYAKYTNFGMQKFRIDFEGEKKLQLCENSRFKFKIPRYADMLMDTYFVITLPNIWSPIYSEDPDDPECDDDCVPHVAHKCQAYEFKWIENLGAQMIRRVRYLVDDNIIQEFTGQYLYSMVQRDFSQVKKDLFDKMIGNVPELNDPANYSNRNGNYPNASYCGHSRDEWPNGVEPSIRGRQLYVPLNIWSTLSSKLAIPLVSMQYSQLYIEIECRPIEDLFVIRDIDSYLTWINDPSFSDPSYNDSRGRPAPYIHADQSKEHDKFFYFLKEPPPEYYYLQANGDEHEYYYPMRTDWDADIHLMSTYAFLSDEEVRVFATQCQSYLIREVHEYTLYNVLGTQRKLIDTLGLVASWMWFFQRTDVGERNEWSNYSNWPYNVVPKPPTQGIRWDVFTNHGAAIFGKTKGLLPYPVPCPAVCPPSEFLFMQYSTGQQHIENEKNIMTRWGLYLDGKVREVVLDAGVTNYIDKYIRTAGGAKSGIYCYNFCLTTDPFQYQPTGAINLSKFNTVEFEYTTILPMDASQASISVTCDASGNPIDPTITSANKNYWKLFKYAYNLHIMEERYNILTIENGVANLALAR